MLGAEAIRGPHRLVVKRGCQLSIVRVAKVLRPLPVQPEICFGHELGNVFISEAVLTAVARCIHKEKRACDSFSQSLKTQTWSLRGHLGIALLCSSDNIDSKWKKVRKLFLFNERSPAML